MKKKRTTTITRLIVGMNVWNTLFIVAAVLVISGIFFFKQITSIYDEMDKAVTGAGFSQADPALVEELAGECNSIFEGIDNPKELYDEDVDAYYAKFSEIPEHDGYKELQDTLNSIRAGTQATEIDMVIFYPGRGVGIYIMDARDVTLIPCGELFEIEGKYFDKDTLNFKGFYSVSRYFGRLRTNGIPVNIDRDNGVCVYMTADTPTSVINNRVSGFVIQITLFSLLLCALISIGIIQMLRKQMIRPIRKISDLADDFVGEYENRSGHSAGSHIFQDVDAGTIEEVRALLFSMQSMELEMNSYLTALESATAERERISTELSLATRIQADMLPNTFPPFPERGEFDIYATMTPAKEVGGDFYDFFMIDDDHLGLVMADVSGKGVPAALFMMASKILVQNYAMMGNSPAEVLKSVNDQICANNREEMFVTVWFGVLTISSGLVTAANAGHEYPILKQGNGGFELLKDKHGFVIGGMEGMKYKEYEISLGKGDVLFLYTDGVAEATNAENEMFGTQRMLNVLNDCAKAGPKEMLENMKSAVDDFVGDAPQFDDLTMLALSITK